MATLSVIFRKEDILGAMPAVAERAVVVIDVLRASTTMVTALANGAREIILASTPEEAREHAAKRPAGSYLLGGERGGLLIDGFDLGNSPRDYSAQRVSGKTIVFTTTNGTAALRLCAHAGADSMWIGSLLNSLAVARAAIATGNDVVLVGAGTEGTQGSDDAFAAGAIVDAAMRMGHWELDDSAVIALNHFRAHASNPGEVLRQSLGGRNLIRIGLGADIDDCDGSRGTFEIAPAFDAGSNAVN